MVSKVAAGLAAVALATACVPAQASTTDLSVLTYNVHGLPWPLAFGRPRQLREIGAELARMRQQGRAPDVVLIQEGFSGDIRELIQLSGYRYWVRGPSRGARLEASEAAGLPRALPSHYRRSGEGWGKFAGSGLYVLSAYPLQLVGSAPYNSCAGWDCLANKSAMLVHVEVNGVPGGVEIANTHLNSRRAAGVPIAWSLQAYGRQVSELHAFLDRRPEPLTPLLVGGDFNVRNAPDRYSELTQPGGFAVVGEYCHTSAHPCEPPAEHPWLDRQDLQAFAASGPVKVEPLAATAIFDDRDGRRLSDHEGYLVRYRLTWDASDRG